MGISEIRKIVSPGEAHHKHMVPHQTQPTIGTAANLHFIASLRDANRPQEFTGVNERLNGSVPSLLELKDGYITLPMKPGLGLELDEEAFKRAAEEFVGLVPGGASGACLDTGRRTPYVSRKTV